MEKLKFLFNFELIKRLTVIKTSTAQEEFRSTDKFELKKVRVLKI